MRGYFGIGAEGISKPMNLGNLIRSAHAFGASFVFLVDADYAVTSAASSSSAMSSSGANVLSGLVDSVIGLR